MAGTEPAKQSVSFSAVAREVYRLLEHQPMPLVHGPPVPEAAALLHGKSPGELFPGAEHAEAAAAGLWLGAGEWDEAHEIAQGLGEAEGAYWHAIIHRQEPDAWNAKYWFRQMGGHAIFPELASAAHSINAQAGNKLALPDEWDPAVFVDICCRANGTDLEQPAREVQQAEWRLLLNYCARSRAR